MALLVVGCSLTTSLDDLTGGLADAGARDASDERAPIDDAEPPSTDAALDVLDVLDALDAADSADAGPSYRALVMADAPIAYFRLGEASGTAARSEIANVAPGTYRGPISLGATGAIVGDPSSGVGLNGSSGDVSFDNRFEFALAAPSSIELWAKPDVIDSEYRPLFTKRLVNDGGQVDGYWLFVRLESGAANLHYESIRNGGYTVAVLPIQAGVFHHIVASQDASSLRLTVDGVTTTSAAPTPRVVTNAPFLLGAESFAASHFNGVLDELAIYDRVLPLTTAAAHYASGRGLRGGTD